MPQLQQGILMRNIIVHQKAALELWLAGFL